MTAATNVQHSAEPFRVVVADPAQIRKALDKFYPQDGDSGLSDLLKELGSDLDISKEVADVAAVDHDRAPVIAQMIATAR